VVGTLLFSIWEVVMNIEKTLRRFFSYIRPPELLQTDTYNVGDKEYAHLEARRCPGKYEGAYFYEIRKKTQLFSEINAQRLVLAARPQDDTGVGNPYRSFGLTENKFFTLDEVKAFFLDFDIEHGPSNARDFPGKEPPKENRYDWRKMLGNPDPVIIPQDAGGKGLTSCRAIGFDHV
jgi:hypothetical protein